MTKNKWEFGEPPGFWMENNPPTPLIIDSVVVPQKVKV